MNRKLKTVIATALAFTVALPTVYISHVHDHDHDEVSYSATSDSEDTPVDIFLIGSGLVDAAPIDRINGEPYYKTDSHAPTGGTKSKST